MELKDAKSARTTCWNLLKKLYIGSDAPTAMKAGGGVRKRKANEVSGTTSASGYWLISLMQNADNTQSTSSKRATKSKATLADTENKGDHDAVKAEPQDEAGDEGVADDTAA